MVKIVDGRELRDQILLNLKEEVASLSKKPRLAIILVGDNEASLRYIKQKQSACEGIGASSVLISFSDTVSQKELEDKLAELNQDQSATGIIVQLPLPKTLDGDEVIGKIAPQKDVDGLTDSSPFQPATPLAIMQILHHYQTTINGKTAVVLGRSKLVGGPVKQMLEKEGAKVIQIHSQTPKPIGSLVSQGDIVVAAVGKEPKLVTAAMVKLGAAVIDVGINRDPESGKLVGDVDFENVKEKASLITPVPGGVGPLTVAMLLSNLIKATEKQ